MLDLRRFFLLFATLFVAIAVQVRMLEMFGNSVDLVFVSLIVFAFWDTIAEQLLLTVLGVWLLNWRPGFAPELLFLAFFPLAIFLLRSYVPWRRGITMLLGIVIGLVALYVIAGATAVFSLRSFLWKDIAGSLFFGSVLFWVLRALYHPKAHGFGRIYALPR